MPTVRNQDWSEVDIIVVIVRPVDNHGSEEPSCILRRIVGMVPRSTIQVGFETVSSTSQDMLYAQNIKTYVKAAPGAIGHCWTLGTPSYHGVAVCRRPCQWSVVPSSGSDILFVTCTVVGISRHGCILLSHIASLMTDPQCNLPNWPLLLGLGIGC